MQNSHADRRVLQVRRIVRDVLRPTISVPVGHHRIILPHTHVHCRSGSTVPKGGSHS